MTKQVFMQQMDHALAQLTYAVRKDILADFEEHFANGLASGKTEEEVAKDLGDPVVLAGQYTEGLPEPKQPVTGAGVARGILAGFALILFDAIIAIPVISVIFAIWISFWSIVIALLGAALVCFVAPFVGWFVLTANALVGLGTFAMGISLLALAVLAGIGMVYVSKWLFKGLFYYIKAHIRIIKGGATV